MVHRHLQPVRIEMPLVLLVQRPEAFDEVRQKRWPHGNIPTGKSNLSELSSVTEVEGVNVIGYETLPGRIAASAGNHRSASRVALRRALII